MPGTPLAKARSNRPHVPELGCSISSSAVVFSLALSCPSLAQSAESSANHAVVLLENQGVQPAASAFPHSSIVTRPVSSGSPSKTEAAATKKDQPSWYGSLAKPGFFAIVDQSSAWNFPGTGSSWGTGAGAGATSLGIGVS